MFDVLDRPSLPQSCWGPINRGLLISALRKSDAPLSVYVHIISKFQKVSAAYIENLIAEMDLVEVAHGRLVTQVHWGGSPHALDPRQRIELFNAILTRFPLAFGADVSLGFHTGPGVSDSPEYDLKPGTDLIGFGVGAISNVGDIFTQNFSDLEAYEDAIAADRVPVSRGFIRGRRP